MDLVNSAGIRLAVVGAVVVVIFQVVNGDVVVSSRAPLIVPGFHVRGRK